MGNQSKLLGVKTSCIEYVHPWTDSCVNATAGLLVVSALDSFRLYTIVYVVSLTYDRQLKHFLTNSLFSFHCSCEEEFLRRKTWAKPLWESYSKCFKLPNASVRILNDFSYFRSTAFLTTSAFSYSAYMCFLRSVLGEFNIWTASYIPAFMSSFTAILVERPSRRSLLTMYVANNATEALWKMAESRNLVKSIPKGQVIIFSLASSALIYYFRTGMHLENKDSVYDIIRFIVGSDEEGGPKAIKEPVAGPSKRRPSNYLMIQKFLELYIKMTDKLKALPKHDKCPHKNSCVYYAASSGTKLFGIGLGVQVALKLIMNIQKIAASPKKIGSILFVKDTLRIGAFLGGFSSIYRVRERY